MSDLLGTTIDDLVSALRRRRAPLPFEIGTFVALCVCDALATAPAVVLGKDVRVAPDGTVSVFVPPNSASGEAAARSVVALLAQMLVAAGPGVPHTLLSLIERGPADGSWGLERVRQELASALVPLNRGASQRVLARLVRESTREQRAGSMPPAPEGPAGGSLDDDLDALLGGDVEPVPPAREVPTAAALDDDLDALFGDAPVAAAPAATPAARVSPVPAQPVDQRDAAALDDHGVDELFDTLAGGPAPPLDDETANADEPTGSHQTGRPPALAAAAEFEHAHEHEHEHGDEHEDEGEHEHAHEGEHAFGRPEITQDVSLAEMRLPPPARVPSEATPKQTAPATKPSASKRDVAREAIESPLPPAPVPAAPRVVADRLSLDGFDDAPKKGTGPLLAVVALLALFAALAGGVYVFRPDLIDRLRGAPDPAEAAAARLAEERRLAQIELNARAAARFGDLLVRSTPDRTQVLLYIGRGPAIAKDLPIGVAHEFVVLADGKASARAVVAPDADWETTPEGKRYELAMQAGDEDVAFDALDLGPTKLPRDVGTPGTELGQVRVITAPRGAKVYQLIGFTPDVRITDVRTDEAVELLLFAEGYVPQRVLVGPSDWRDVGGERVAEVTATLVERSSRRR